MSEYTNEDIAMAVEWRKCAPDWDTATTQELAEGFRYFCAKYGRIKHPSEGRIPFVLRDAQEQTVQAWLDNRYSVVLKARQIGFSTLVSIFCFWLTYFYPDRSIIMLSRTEREAAKLLSHAKYLYRALPEWFRLLGPFVNFTQTKCELTNNSALESMPSANDPARGSTAFTIVVDEIAFLPNSDEAWAAIEPVVDVGGRCIMLSTANGEGNLFHTLWVGSQTKAGTGAQFHGIFFPWWASDRDEHWYAAKKAELPDWQLAQEYPDNPDEAFLKSGRPVFDLEMLRTMVPEEPDRGYLARDVDTGAITFVEEQGGGALAVWEHPEPLGVYVIGADVAMGLEIGDFSSAHVINARTGAVCAHWWGKGDPDVYGESILATLGRYYNTALTAVENNNHGLTTVTALARVKYPNQYRNRQLNKKSPKPTQTYGWNTNRATKPLMVDELNKAIRDGSLDIKCAHTLAELRTFKRMDDGKMQGSPHDDRVMSLGIAVQMLRWVWVPQYRVHKPKPGAGTWGRLVDRAFSSAVSEPSKRFIGAFAARDAA